MTQNDYIHFYDRDLQRLINEMEAYTDPEQIWLVAPVISNSAGHLAQHLIGNLKTFVIDTLGGFPYQRDRDAEFNSRRFSYEELLAALYALKIEVVESIKRIADVAAPYPKEIKDLCEGQTIDFMLCHLLAHLAYHTGQINYHRRLLGTSVTPVQK